MSDRRPNEERDDDLLRKMLEDAQGDYVSKRHHETQQEAVRPPGPRVSENTERTPREALIQELDELIAAQVDEVRRHPSVQRLKSAWRGLRYLIDRVDFEENIRVELLNCSKEDLANDFEQAIDVTVSGLYRRMCDPNPSRYGASSVSLIVADFQFDHHQQDMELLGHCAAVAADAHAPFVAKVGPRFFGCEHMAELPSVGELPLLFQSPRYAPWESFRSSEDARYVALCASDDDGDDPPASHVFAGDIASAFADRRWFEGLAEGQNGCAGSGESGISKHQMKDMASAGLIPIARRPDGSAASCSSNSAQRPKRFPDTHEGRARELNSRAAADLPNVLNISRLAHYIEALGDQAAASQDLESLEQDLQQWLWETICGGEPVKDSAERVEPVREARISLSDHGYLRYELQLQTSREEGAVTLWLAGALRDSP